MPKFSLTRFTAALSLLALTSLAVAPLRAVTAPAATAGKAALAGMVDVRVDAVALRQQTARRAGGTAAVAARARQQVRESRAALAALAKAIPGVSVRTFAATGGIDTLKSRGGGLTAAAPGAGDEQIVRGFLAAHGQAYGLAAEDLGDLVALGDSPGGTTGLRMLRMEQQIDGLPVFQSETRFLIDRQGRLVETTGRMVPHARAVAPQRAAQSFMTPQAALVKLLAASGRSAKAADFTVTGEQDGRLRLAENDDFVAGEITARKMLFPLAPGTLVPAWSLVVFTTGEEDWYALVDAENGSLLWRKNIRDYASAHDARFRVYVQADGVTPADSPAPQSPNTVAPGSGTQFPEIAPAIVSMHTAYDSTASPNGWIDDCPGGVCTAAQTQTLGNNVLACLDAVGGANANICDTAAGTALDNNGRPTGNPDANARNRDFLGTTPRDFETNYLPPPQGGNPEAGQTSTGAGNAGTLPIDQYRRGMVTHLFYVINWYHDQLFKLGFDEPSANFQLANFQGLGGAPNDRVNADAQDGSGTNNANFSTPPDGTSGRAQMFRFTGPTIDRDGDLDAEVLMHELTHGTSNRLVGNAVGLNWDTARGMGEGWSDFVAMSLLNNTNADNPDARYASGAYATYKLSGLVYLDNYVYGIRRFPYSTDNTVNPMTWADVDDVTNDLSGGITPTPVTFNLNGGNEVHNAGEIWALTLWEVRSRVIADPAGANGDVPTGNHTMLQLVIDGLKATPIDPSYLDARDAIIDADCTTNACANEASIWGGFADRGLGYGALEPYNVMGRYVSSHVGIGESFSVPKLDVHPVFSPYPHDPAPDVTIDDSAGNNNGAIDPGEAVKLTVRLTNPWRAASKAVASATANLATVTPGITIYDNASTYGAIAPQATVAGDTFTFTVDPTVTCGSSIIFTLTTTSSLGVTGVTFRLRVGNPVGTDPVVTYTRDDNPDLTITNGRPRGVLSQQNITDDFQIADVNFRVDAATSPGVGDLTFMLRSPEGIGVDLIMLIDGLNDLGGTAITNMVIDDDVAPGPTTDMVQATTADAPYTKSWLPVYNSPWAALVDPSRPADPDLQLRALDGRSTQGTWSVIAADVFTAAQGGTDGNGTLGAWSLLVTPVHFDCVAFAPAATVTATKTVTGTFSVGGMVTYHVTLTNNGTANQADNAGHEFSDTLPAGLTLSSITSFSGGVTQLSGNTASWDGSIAPLGGTVTLQIDAFVNAGTQGTSISNQGTASYDSNNDGTNDASALTDDPAVGGATDPTVFTVPNAAVTATKTVSGTFNVGGTVTYTVVLSNSGSAATPDNAGNEFTDVLPASLTLVSAIPTSGIAGTAGNTATWNGSIPAGGSVTITITATVNSGAQGTTINNQGTVVFDADLNGTNESSALTDDPALGGAADPTAFVVAGAVLSATETVSGTFTTGSTVTYTAVVTNSGSAATLDDAGDEFTTVLPAALTLVGSTASIGSTVATVGTNTVTWDGSIPAGGSLTLTITATIKPGFVGTTVSNQGALLYDADLNGTNETAGQTDDPTVPGAADPTVFVVLGSAIEVPTLSQTGFAILALAMFAGAIAVLRRRRTNV